MADNISGQNPAFLMSSLTISSPANDLRSLNAWQFSFCHNKNILYINKSFRR